MVSFLLMRREVPGGYRARDLTGSGSPANQCGRPLERKCIEAHTVKSYSISSARSTAISLCHVTHVDSGPLSGSAAFG